MNEEHETIMVNQKLM